MQAQFFYIGALSFIFAIAVGTSAPVVPAYYLFLFLLGAALCVVAWLYRQSPSWVVVATVAVGLLLSGMGLWRADLVVSQYAESPLHFQVGQEVMLQGLVVREPEGRESNIQLFVRVDESNDLLLVSVDRFSEVTYGDTISVSGKLEVPEAFVTDYGRTFLYPQYLKAKGVQFRISFAQVEVIESGGGNPIVVGLLRFKQAFVAKLGTVLSEPQSGLGVGLLLGVKRALGEELEE
nr:DUF4131 domain-containing protein [Candidatus Paceibacterota bacterium]